jgi:lipoprotein-anchoring transpeptidase ErfK/SrfK
MIRVGAHGAATATGRLWRIAVLTAAGAVGATSQAEAALYYWSDSDSGYSRPGHQAPQRRQKPGHHQAKKIDAPEKESAKPQGPLIIAISIDKQNVKIYDANGFFAEAPVSTGMKGHPTPMGVFSVIQKHKLHHSNIYSGAPMPFMQRITWSGVAMHAGVLPGYPASHGCIRMPMAFAVKMWNWTKMGARVVVTPGEMTPASFSHPLLVTQKVVPGTAGEPQADTPPAAKTDKASDAATISKSAVSEANLELRPTIGHSDGAKPAMVEPSASASLREQTHTADASVDMPATKAPVTMTDAASSGGNAASREEPAARTDGTPPTAADAGKIEDASKADAAAEVATSEVAKPEAATAEIKPAEAGATGAAGTKPDDAAVAAQPASNAVKPAAPATASMTADETAANKTLEAKADEVKADSPKPDVAKSDEKSDDKPGEAVKADTSPGAADAKKDQARLPDPAKPALGKIEAAIAAAPKHTGQIAVFISRKDSKLYVRQNFAPLFDVPVTIAPSDRPLGTHVFTAQIDKADANVVHWSVVTLPVPSRHAERHEEDERALRRRKIAGASVEVKPLPVPDSPTEALDRVTIPSQAMAWITDALSTGASIIVSDQGINAGETGEGTDFIVSLR